MKKKLTIDDLKSQLAEEREKYELFIRYFHILEGETLESLGIVKAPETGTYPEYAKPYRNAYLAYQAAKEGITLCDTLSKASSLTSIHKKPERLDALKRFTHNRKKTWYSYIENFYAHRDQLTEADIPGFKPDIPNEKDFDKLEPHIKRANTPLSSPVPGKLAQTLKTLIEAQLNLPTIKQPLDGITKNLVAFKKTLHQLSEKSEFFIKRIQGHPLDQSTPAIISRAIVSFPIELHTSLEKVYTAEQLLSQKYLYNPLMYLIEAYKPDADTYKTITAIHRLYKDRDKIQLPFTQADLEKYYTPAENERPIHEFHNISTFLGYAKDIMELFTKPLTASPSQESMASPKKPGFDAFRSSMVALAKQAQFFLDHTAPLFKNTDNAQHSTRVIKLLTIREYYSSNH